MAKGLSGIDNAAASKGKGIETLWQFIKFIVVSLGAFVIQTVLPIIIKLFMSEEFQTREFTWWIFHDVSEIDKKTGELVITGLGLFLAANIANIVAQIVSFFINRDKTFNSDANIAVTLPIYIVFTIALICFSAWLSPTLINFFQSHGVNTDLSLFLSGAICGAIQFFLYFPFDKLLFPKKKEAVAEGEAADVEAVADLTEEAVNEAPKTVQTVTEAADVEAEIKAADAEYLAQKAEEVAEATDDTVEEAAEYVNDAVDETVIDVTDAD